MLLRLFTVNIFIVSFVFADLYFSAIPMEKIKNEKKYNLGKWLFFDKNLSADKTISCASCHDFSKGGADGSSVSLGVARRKGVFNSPTIFNDRFNVTQDWSGEYTTIKDRAKMAFLSKIEMAGDIHKVVEYVKSDKYLQKEFKEIYKTINEDVIFDAIAYFVSNLTTPNSKFDKYLKGDATALNKDEKEGYKLFKNYGCASCHNGVNLGGNMYQKIGIFNEDKIIRDKYLGRYKITKKESDKYVYKVPSLRYVTKTFPYLHNGSVKDLKKVIKMMAKYQLGVEMSNEDAVKIELFLKSLVGDIPR